MTLIDADPLERLLDRLINHWRDGRTKDLGTVAMELRHAILEADQNAKIAELQAQRGLTPERMVMALQFHGSMKKAAKSLGVSANGLRYHMRKHKIPPARRAA